MYLPKTETAKISRQPTRVHLQGFLGWLVSWGSDNLHQLACYSIHGWKYRAIFSKIKILNYIQFYKLISVDFWWLLIYLSSSYHFHCSYQTKVKRTECILSLFCLWMPHPENVHCGFSSRYNSLICHSIQDMSPTLNVHDSVAAVVVPQVPCTSLVYLLLSNLHRIS